MKLLTAVAWVAITLILVMMYLDDPADRLAVGSGTAVLVFLCWIGQTSLIEEALANQRKYNEAALTEAYERGRRFGAIHAEDVQEEITLARQRGAAV